jgi:outer membrane protein
MNHPTLRRMLGVLLGLFGILDSAAGAAAGAPAPAGWTVRVGGGLLAGPAFAGSKDYQLKTLPSVRLAYGDVFFASVEDGIGYRVINGTVWKAAPLLGYDFGRDADGGSTFRIAGKKSRALAGFPDIDGTLTAGFRLQRPVGPWDATLELRRALGSHRGLTAQLATEQAKVLREGQRGGGGRWTLVTGPRATWGDNAYQAAFFGLTPAVAAASGLPVYTATSGLVSAGWGLNVIGSLEGDWSMVGLLRYERLLGDAADSPLVRQRGRADQLTGGLFLSLRL